MPTPAPAGSPATELVEHLLAYHLTSWSASSAPPSSASPGAASSPTPPSSAATARSTGFLRHIYRPARALFVPFMEFRPLDPDQRDCYPLDCHHGRALLYDENSRDLLLWDPMTGEKKHIREPGIRRTYFNAAVLCARANCDHLDCHGGPFLVAFVGTNEEDAVAQAFLYSSETDAWSAPAFAQNDYYMDVSRPPVLVGEALYFICQLDDTILRYHLAGDRDLSILTQPGYFDGGTALIPAEDGGLWFIGFEKFTLYLWTVVAATDPEKDDVWERCRVIRLNVPHIGRPFQRPALIGTARCPDSDIVFVSMYAGVFMIDLESECVTKVFERDEYLEDIFPYMSFCTPGSTICEVQNNVPAKGLDDGIKALYLEAP